MSATVLPFPANKRPFSWSFSRMKNYEACPFKHKHVDIDRTARDPGMDDPEGPLMYGNRVHDMMQKRLMLGTPFELGFGHLEEWAARAEEMVKNGGRPYAELSLAITEDYKPTDWRSGRAWYRAKIDWLVIKGRIAVMWDWKTGKIKEDSEQLGLNAIALFVHNPGVDVIQTEYIWLAEDARTSERYRRRDMMAIMNRSLPLVNEMKASHENGVYPQQPSGLCKRYCPVTQCPYYGKGSTG